MNQQHLFEVSLFSLWDFIEYGRAMQDSYVSELFALDNNLLIHSYYSKMTSYSQEDLRKLNKDDFVGIALSKEVSKSLFSNEKKLTMG